MAYFKDKVVFITGASRGIGLCIAKRLAQDGANIVIAAKTDTPHPKLPGTIYTAAKEIEQLGGSALPIKVDIRNEDDIKTAFNQTIEHFGKLDILINNASAIFLSTIENTDQKHYDLMHQINGRGSFLCTKYAIPYLKKSDNPHILNASPPVDILTQPFAKLGSAYIAAKLLMTMWTITQAPELAPHGIAVNSIWPSGAIDTAAIRNLMPQFLASAHKPEMVADACYILLQKDSRKFSGHCLIVEELLKQHGITDLSPYKC